MGEPRPSQSPAVTAIALSVTCGDSSPRGRAKEGEPRRESQGGRAKGILPLPLGEVAERSEGGEGILPLPMGEVAERSEGGEGILPLPLGEVAERSEDGEGILPLPLGEVAERSEDGEGEDVAGVP